MDRFFEIMQRLLNALVILLAIGALLSFMEGVLIDDDYLSGKSFYNMVVFILGITLVGVVNYIVYKKFTI